MPWSAAGSRRSCGRTVAGEYSREDVINMLEMPIRPHGLVQRSCCNSSSDIRIRRETVAEGGGTRPAEPGPGGHHVALDDTVRVLPRDPGAGQREQDLPAMDHPAQALDIGR